MAINFNAGVTKNQSIVTVHQRDVGQRSIAVWGWATLRTLTMGATAANLVMGMPASGLFNWQVGYRLGGANVAGMRMDRLADGGDIYRVDTNTSELASIATDTPFFFCVMQDGSDTGETAGGASARTQIWLRLPGETIATSRACTVTMNASPGGGFGAQGATNRDLFIANRNDATRGHDGDVWDVGMVDGPAGTFCLTQAQIEALSQGLDPTELVLITNVQRQLFMRLATLTQLENEWGTATGTANNSPTTSATPRAHVPSGGYATTPASTDGAPLVGTKTMFVDSTRLIRSASPPTTGNAVILIRPAGTNAAVWEQANSAARGDLCLIGGREGLSVWNIANAAIGNVAVYTTNRADWSNAGWHAALIVSTKNLNSFADNDLVMVGGSTAAAATAVGVDGRGRLYVRINGNMTLLTHAAGAHMRVTCRPMPVLVNVTEPGGASVKVVTVRTPWGTATVNSTSFTASNGPVRIGAVNTGSGALLVNDGSRNRSWNLYRAVFGDTALDAAQQATAWDWLAAKSGVSAYTAGMVCGFTSTDAGTGVGTGNALLHNMTVPALISVRPSVAVMVYAIGGWVGDATGADSKAELVVSAAPPGGFAVGDAITQGSATGVVWSVAPDGLSVIVTGNSTVFTAAAAFRGADAITITTVRNTSIGASAQWLNEAGNSTLTWAIDALKELPAGLPAIFSPFFSSGMAVWSYSLAGSVAMSERLRAYVAGQVTGRTVYYVPREAHPREPFGVGPATGGALNEALNASLRALTRTIRLPALLDYLDAGGASDGGAEAVNDPNGANYYLEAAGSRVHLSTDGAILLAGEYTSMLDDLLGVPWASRMDRFGRGRLVR